MYDIIELINKYPSEKDGTEYKTLENSLTSCADGSVDLLVDGRSIVATRDAFDQTRHFYHSTTLVSSNSFAYLFISNVI